MCCSSFKNKKSSKPINIHRYKTVRESSGHRSIQDAEPSDARDPGLDPDLDPGLEPDLDPGLEPGLDPVCLLPRLRPSSRVSAASLLARLTNIVGGWADAISNLSSAALLLLRAEAAFLLVLGWGDGGGSAATALREDEEASPAEEEEPSLANATGISSRDSAESEWYSAGGAAAWTGARGGREALRGNAGKGRR